MLNNESPLLTKLEQMWDYVHIDDVVDALCLIGKLGKAGAIYTVGHGDNRQLKNYIEIEKTFEKQNQFYEKCNKIIN